MLPINPAICAKIRDSPAGALRLPNTASASSTITATGVSALRMLSVFSRFDCVMPGCVAWKLHKRTMGIPISPANAETINDLPVPIGPEIRYPIGNTSALPCLMARTALYNLFFTKTFPATYERSQDVSTNSNKPPASCSIISCFFLFRNCKVAESVWESLLILSSGFPFASIVWYVSAASWWRFTKFKPEVSLPIFSVFNPRSSTKISSWVLRYSRKRIRVSSFGRGM